MRCSRKRLVFRDCMKIRNVIAVSDTFGLPSRVNTALTWFSASCPPPCSVDSEQVSLESFSEDSERLVPPLRSQNREKL